MNNFIKVSILLLISSYCIAQPQMSVWWVPDATGQAITHHANHDIDPNQEGPLPLACGAEVYLRYNDNTSGAYDVIYHILNEGDEDLNITSLSLSTNDAEYSLNTYGSTFPITVPANHEFEFIITYDSPASYRSSTASVLIGSDDSFSPSCGIDFVVGFAEQECTLGDPSNFSMSISGTNEEVMEAFFEWQASLPCRSNFWPWIVVAAADVIIETSPRCTGSIIETYNCCNCNFGLQTFSVDGENCSGFCDNSSEVELSERLYCPYLDITLNIGGGGVTPIFTGGDCNACATFDFIITGDEDCNTFIADLTDPCSCSNPKNVLVGGEVLFQDVLVSNSTTSGLTVLLASNDGNLLDATGTPIAVGTPLMETSIGVYELEFFTKANSPAIVQVSHNGILIPSINPFTTDSCSVCQVVPTMGEWGLISLGLLLLIMGIVTIKQRKIVMT